MPEPGIPTVALAPLFPPKLSVAPGTPTDQLVPPEDTFRYRPGAIFRRFLKLNPINPPMY